MQLRIFLTALVLLVIGTTLLLHGGTVAPLSGSTGAQPGAGLTASNCVLDECSLMSGLSYPVGELSEEGHNALAAALAFEREQLARFQAARTTFGMVRPFVMLARTQEQQIALLSSMHDKYGIALPETATQEMSTAQASPDALVDACREALVAERAGYAQYNRLIERAAGRHDDLVRVFVQLAAASNNRHIPALKLCAQLD